MKALLVVALLLAGAARAEEKDPRPDMHVMAAEISALQKYMLSDAEFAAPANEAAIRKSLANIDDHLEHLNQGAFANDPALRVNLSLLRQHVKDASRAFGEGQKPFARYMLQSSLQMCIACHTRKKAADFAWPDVDAAKDLAPIDKADYLFATRQFKKGVAVYEGIVDGFPGNKVSQWNVQKALLALAVYYARVAEDPKGGAEYFRKAAAKEALPQYIREQLKAWGEEFGAWAREKPAKPDDKLTESELLAKAKKLLRHDDFSLVSELERSYHVRRLRASTLLQRALEMPGGNSPTKAEALLYLGQIYGRISSNLFFRFGEMYLKACIADYPKSAIARRCYVALESVVTEGYSGSGGTNIPDDEQVELMRLKRLAY